MNTNITILITVALVSLSACATLNKSECIDANWQQIGAADGESGQLKSHLAKHQQACEKHGVAVDTDSYGLGRAEGLNTYCTVKNAYAEGMRGNEYGGVCPEERASEFQHAYVEGLKIRLDSLYLANSRLDFALFNERLRRSPHNFRHPHNRPYKTHRGRREDELYALRNQHRRLLIDRLTIQRWIIHWSAS